MFFAVNERYLINEKGAGAGAERLPLRVPEFRATVEEILGHLGRSPEELRASLQLLEGMGDGGARPEHGAEPLSVLLPQRRGEAQRVTHLPLLP